MTPPIILKHYSPIAPPSIKDVNKMEDWAARTNNFEMFRYEDYIKVTQFSGEICTIAILKSVCKYINDVVPGPSSPNSFHDVNFQIYFKWFYFVVYFICMLQLFFMLQHLILDYTSSLLSGSGYRQFMHFAQLAVSGRFQKVSNTFSGVIT